MSSSASSDADRDHATAAAGRVAVGDVVPARTLEAISGPVRLPHESGLTHLQLRRFAGCPICNLHLRSVVQRADELAAAGVHEIIVFHSSAAELEQHQPELPLPIVPDPGRELYRAFGVERSIRALLAPRLWPSMPRVLRGAARSIRREHVAPSLRPEGGQLGLPADVLLESDGRVRAIKYGEHAYDQWTVDELLSAAR